MFQRTRHDLPCSSQIASRGVFFTHKLLPQPNIRSNVWYRSGFNISAINITVLYAVTFATKLQRNPHTRWDSKTGVQFSRAREPKVVILKEYENKNNQTNYQME